MHFSVHILGFFKDTILLKLLIINKCKMTFISIWLVITIIGISENQGKITWRKNRAVPTSRIIQKVTQN